MSNTKHTPGPWVEVKSPQGDTYAISHGSTNMDFSYIALFDGKCSANFNSNAKLIAAAPDLLEICQIINASEPLPKHISDHLEWAIKKATE